VSGGLNPKRTGVWYAWGGATHFDLPMLALAAEPPRLQARRGLVFDASSGCRGHMKWRCRSAWPRRGMRRCSTAV